MIVRQLSFTNRMTRRQFSEGNQSTFHLREEAVRTTIVDKTRPSRTRRVMVYWW